jgi:hypothetical protein
MNVSMQYGEVKGKGTGRKDTVLLLLQLYKTYSQYIHYH